MQKDFSSGIYQYSFKSGGRKYIGCAIDLKRRMQNHLSSLKGNTHFNKHFQNDYNEYGLSNLVYQVLEFVDNKLWLNKEIPLKTFVSNLFEIEQRYLDSYFAQEALRDTSDKRFYRSLYNKSPIARYGFSEERIDNQKTVYQYSLDGQYLDSFSNSIEASACTNIDSSSIRRCCDGIRKSAGGFYWSYIKEERVEIPARVDEKKIKQYSILGDFVKEWKSIAAAENALGIRITPVYSKTSGGFVWRYV